MPEDEAIAWALNSLQQGGKGELDTTLNQVSHQYRGVSPLLHDTLAGRINFIRRQTEGAIYDVLDYLASDEALLRSLRDEDFIGTLFERAVSDAFRGDDGRFYTPRNIILTVREMVRLLLEMDNPDRPLSSYTVCDPCCGSARFLIYWAELLIREIEQERLIIERPELLKRLKETAESALFGADIHEDTAAYGCLNMLLHGDGASNITAQDSLDHFGFFANMPLLQAFAVEFQERWDSYKNGPARHRADLAEVMEAVESNKNIVADLPNAGYIDLADKKWSDLMRLIRQLLDVDTQYPTEWKSIRALKRRYKRRAVFETMVDEWSHRNPDIINGFDVLITNPPFGRQSALMISNPYILCQYRLATEVWVRDMSKDITERLLARTLTRGRSMHQYYIALMIELFGKAYVEDQDEVGFEKLKADVLRSLAASKGIATGGKSKEDLIEELANELKRYIVTRTDNIKLDDLTSAATKQICSAYLYEDGNPGEKLAAQIVAHFGKEWLTVEDIEGPEGYASKVTLTFNDQPHTIYYDEKDEPIIYKSPLPKQVLFVEQFLRMVKEGGKVFTVLDTGVLSNLEDEYIRRFFFKSARWWATVEFFHGAFKAARANVKTAIVLLERRNEPDLDYEIYGAIPQYLGYNLRKQDTPPIFENDLGSVVCDFSAFLSGQRPRQHDSCPWSEKRYCCFGDEVGMDRSKDPLFSQLEFGSEEQEVLEVDGISTGE